MQTNNSKEKVRQLQNKLYLTAKKCDSRRFHALYDKVYRDDILFEAWKRVKANKGSSGVDGIRIEDIEAISHRLSCLCDYRYRFADNGSPRFLEAILDRKCQACRYR